VALAGPLGSHWQRARAAHALAYVLVEEGTRLDQALTHYAAAAADYERAGDLRREAITHVNRGAALAALGRLGESLDSLDLAIQRARAVGNHRATAVALENRGAVRRMIGDREQARADLGDALARARQVGHRALVEVASVELLYVALGGGTDDDELRRLAEGVRPSLDGDLGPTHLAAGTAVVIRALGRLGATDEPLVARARRLVDDPGLPLSSRAELRVALWEVDDRREADAVAFAALLGAIVVDALDAEDATIRARAVYRRFETPPALAAWVEARR
jgi:tetratricopeptide (TPR) repeat protein